MIWLNNVPVPALCLACQMEGRLLWSKKEKWYPGQDLNLEPTPKAFGAALPIKPLPHSKSRFLKVVPRLGLESSESTNKDWENAALTHLGTHQDSDLVKIITAWSHLPCPLKAAILAIVKSTEDER